MVKTATFTEKQVEVVRLVARGFANDEIGEELSVSPRTAKAYCDTLRHKLGVEKKREIPEAYLRLTGDSPYPVPA